MRIYTQMRMYSDYRTHTWEHVLTTTHTHDCSVWRLRKYRVCMMRQWECILIIKHIRENIFSQQHIIVASGDCKSSVCAWCANENIVSQQNTRMRTYSRSRTHTWEHVLTTKHTRDDSVWRLRHCAHDACVRTYSHSRKYIRELILKSKHTHDDSDQRVRK